MTLKPETKEKLKAAGQGIVYYFALPSHIRRDITNYINQTHPKHAHVESTAGIVIGLPVTAELVYNGFVAPNPIGNALAILYISTTIASLAYEAIRYVTGNNNNSNGLENLVKEETIRTI